MWEGAPAALAWAYHVGALRQREARRLLHIAVHCGGADLVHPDTLVAVARLREGSPVELLCVQPKGAHLRGVVHIRHGTLDRLGLLLPADPGHVFILGLLLQAERTCHVSLCLDTSLLRWWSRHSVKLVFFFLLHFFVNIGEMSNAHFFIENVIMILFSIERWSYVHLIEKEKKN